MSEPVIIPDGGWKPTRDDLQVMLDGEVVWQDTGYEFDGETVGKLTYHSGFNKWYWSRPEGGPWASADSEALALEELLCEMLPEFIQTESEADERGASAAAELQGDMDRDEL